MKKNMYKVVFIFGLIIALSNCNFINSFVEESANITSMKFDKGVIELAQGAMDILSLQVNARTGQSNISVVWEYDPNIIRAKYDNYGVVITAIKEGKTIIKATSEGQTTACTVRVLPDKKPPVITHPYVYTSQDFIAVTPSETVKVHAAVYGVPHADINGFSFTIDKPTIASVYTEGNYCAITGLSEGMAKITARHNKSPYAYTFLVSCTASNTHLPYITCSENVIVINKDDSKLQKKISVDMINPPYPTYKDDFVFSVTDENGNIMSEPPITLVKTAHTAEITAHKEGVCYIKITHPSCTYSCDVICRVTQDINKVYIQPSHSYVTINSSDAQTVTLALKNLDEDTIENPDDYIWSFSENAEYYIDYTIFGGSENGKGNSIWITGKRNGAAKITVSHKYAPSQQTILVLVRNSIKEAASSKTYITTSQNYIETMVGQPQTKINITAHNLDDGTQNEFTWSILHQPLDGTQEPVIAYEEGTGNAISRFARSIISMADGYALISPLKEGTAIITITHPKAAYPTKVIVNVLPKNIVVPQTQLSLATDKPLVKIINGESETIEVTLSGIGKTEDDESNIIWHVSDPSFTVLPAGQTAQITATGTGKAKAFLTVTHKKCNNPLSIALIRADTQEDIQTVKTIYTDTASYTMFTGNTIQLSVNGVNLDDTDRFTWECDSGLETIYTFEEHDRIALLTGLSVGTALIKAKIPSIQEPVNFYIQVKQNGIIDEHKPVYFTTHQNVITLLKGNQSDIQVCPINMKTSAYQDITWKNNNPELFDLNANGTSCTINAYEEGQGSITISHPLSKNELTIYVHIGNEYVYKNTNLAYIATEQDTLLLKTDSSETMFSCVLAYTESGETVTNDFTFTGLNNDIFTVNYNPAHNYCLITPVKAGQGVLRIEHPQAELNKEVIVIIEKTDAELSTIPFLSTTQNVVTVIKGESVPITTMLKNTQNYDQSLWSWQSYNTAICNILTDNGNTAMINGIAPGSTKISVSHSSCRYPLEIIVLCLDSPVTESLPWIKLSQNIINLKQNDSTTITAEMIHGNATDSSDFIWTVNNPDIALINGRGESCYVKALKSGFTTITCRSLQNPHIYAKTTYIRVEDTVKEDCYISVQNKIIKLNPTDKNGTTISAQLVNGDPLDAQDFTWWADDNSLVHLISSADQCNIIPTGIAGTTIVHVKHPKVLQPLDIIVMLSKYETFAFTQNSKELCEKTMHVIPMQVPASNGKAKIEYTVENPNICAVTGSNQVCMIAGISPGYTNVYATLSNEKGVIAKTDMAVIVSKKEEAVNTLTVNSTVLNMNIGESQTLEALLSGNDITDPDNYNISWQSDNPDVISVLATENNETKGKNAYITAKRAGEAVVTVSHPKCRFDLQLWIIVPDKQETSLTISDTYLEMYKGDGAKVITAKVINGTSADENAIIWTAPKVGGVNIISISKTKGKSCNIMPLSVGSTTLRAQLPNGNYADCIVTVLSNAEIILETKAIHVNPGYSETIKYTTVPENASINWLSMFNGNTGFANTEQYFSFYANDAAKTLTVTGHKLGSGNIQGYFAANNGSATASIAVYVEYNYNLELKNKGVINTEPRHNALVEIPFTVYPSNLQITAEVSDPAILEVHSISTNENTGEGTVYIKPLKEGISQSVTVLATNPNDLINTPIHQTQIINSAYEQLHITPVFDFATGSYSYYDNNDANPTLYLADGEEVLFYLDIAEENATTDNIQITYQSNTGTNDYDSQIYTQQATQNHIFFSGSENARDPAYGTLRPESVTSDGKHMYRFGHNHDYKTGNGYIVQGKYHFREKITMWFCTIGTTEWYKYYVSPFWFIWLRDPIYYFSNNISSLVKDDKNESGFARYIRERNDTAIRYNNNYYYIEEGAFKANPNFYCNMSTSLQNVHYKTDGFKKSYNTYTINYNQIIYPGNYIPNATSKDTRIVSSAQGRLTISYSDSSGKTHIKSLNVITQRRNCEKCTKGYWVQDAVDGVPAWRLLKEQEFFDKETVFEKYKYVFFDKNNIEMRKGTSQIVRIITNAPESIQNIEWSVENNGVASIAGHADHVVVYGSKEGTTQVKMKFTNSKGETEQKTFSVNIVRPILYPDFEYSNYGEANLIYTVTTENHDFGERSGKHTYNFNDTIYFNTKHMTLEEVKQTSITVQDENMSPAKRNLNLSTEGGHIRIEIDYEGEEEAYWKKDSDEGDSYLNITKRYWPQSFHITIHNPLTGTINLIVGFGFK